MTFEQLKQKVKDLEAETAQLKWARKKAYLMQQCVDRAGDAIFWLDKDANIVYVNNGAQRNFGFLGHELLAKKIFEVMLFEQKDNWPVFYQDVVEQKRLVFESASRTKTGEDLIVELTFSYLNYNEKEVLLLYARDISKSKELEDSSGLLDRDHEERFSNLEQELQEARDELQTENAARLEAETKLASISDEYDERLVEEEKELESVQDELTKESAVRVEAESKLVLLKDEYDERWSAREMELESVQNHLTAEIAARTESDKTFGAMIGELESKLATKAQEDESGKKQLAHETSRRIEAEKLLAALRVDFELLSQGNDEMALVMTQLKEEVQLRENTEELVKVARAELEREQENRKLAIEKLKEQTGRQEKQLREQTELKLELEMMVEQLKQEKKAWQKSEETLTSACASYVERLSEQKKELELAAEQLEQLRQVQKDEEEDLVWTRKEWDKQRAENEKQLFLVQKQLEDQIKFSKTTAAGMAECIDEKEQIFQIKTAEISSLQTLLEKKEDTFKQVFPHYRNELESLAVFFVAMVKKVKKKKRLQLIEKYENIIRLDSFIQNRLAQQDNLLQDNGRVMVADIAKIMEGYRQPDKQNVHYAAAIDKISMSPERAVTCGLIIHELVDNGFKHAFINREKEENNKIALDLHSVSEEEVELSISDNGLGLPADFDLEKCKTWGLPFVALLVNEQLKGTLAINNDKGTEIIVRFPLGSCK